MKLRPPHFSQIPALILLGSLVTAPAVVMGNDYDYEEYDEEATAYGMTDMYGDQADLHRTYQRMYNHLEEDDDMPERWDKDEEEYEDDDQPEEEEDRDDGR